MLDHFRNTSFFVDWIRFEKGFRSYTFLGGKDNLLILRGKQIRLVLVPKWPLACGRQIRVLGAQLLDLVVEQSTTGYVRSSPRGEQSQPVDEGDDDVLDVDQRVKLKRAKEAFTRAT
jgi:hypothetical protein